ncbi:porin family protein [Spirosoma radiotolerans]|uniref:porin family protein n=1 Tax=Spirosoma radiotolerans TaxID=1379870 RepID=UPI00130E7604|nr:porin family protein [Spirosoma radiotolerans]
MALTLLPVGLSIAQSTSTTPTSTTTSGSTNRMQDLYDEHHGINRKKATTTNAPAVSPTEKSATDQSTVDRSPSSQASMDGSTSRTRIGIRGGVTYPFFTEKPVGVDPVLGFVGGLTFNFGTGTVSFQPEVNYTRYSQKVNAFGFTTKRANDVLEVPLLLKISSGTYAGNRFFLNVGPYAAYAMSASEDGKKISLDGTKGRFGFGAAAGVGAAIKAGPGHVTVEVRGLYPLGNTDSGFNTDSKTIFGQGTLGYIFPLGGQ